MRISLSLTMKSPLSLLLASATIALGGGVQPTMTEELMEAPPTQAITALSVQPEKIAIHSLVESAQLLITAKLASGESVDVTRFASLHTGGDTITVSPLGHVAPQVNGRTQVTAEFSGQSIAIPVEVDGLVPEPKVDFIRDVNPVMTKMGCNAGTCHGAKDGKVGFKLSLRGYDPLLSLIHI